MHALKPKVTVRIETTDSHIKTMSPPKLPNLNILSTKNLNALSPMGKGLGLEQEVKT